MLPLLFLAGFAAPALAAPAPTVTNVTSPLANGTYKAGQIVPIQVVFDQAVTVTGGPPQLTLSTGNPATTAVNYSSGSGSTTLVFNYTVAASNYSADLAYASTGALALNGGTIVGGGKNAVLTLAAPGAAGSLSFNKNIVIDTTAPTIAQVTPVPSPTRNTTPSYTFSSNEAGSITYGGDCSSSTASAVNGNNTVTFNTLSPGLHSNCTIVVTDAAGNASTVLSVSAFTIDTTAPTVTGVTSSHANGAFTVGEAISVQVNFSENVAVSGAPQLTLRTGSSATTAASLSGVSGSTLSFTYTVADGDNTADLDYASTGALSLNGGTIRDAAGNDAVLTLATPGAAGSLGANKDIEINTHVPTITSVTSTHANGSFKAGEAIPVTVTFSEPVTSTGSVTVTFETGSTDRSCTFTVSNASSGSCTYTVQSGDTTTDLTTNAINGIIRDSAGNQLVNFVPASNLGDSKDIVIDTAAPTVISTNPTNAATGIALNANISASFSQSLDGSTLTTSTFTLKEGLTPVSGVVSYLGGTAVFNPDSDLSPSTVYTAALTTGIKDPAGNALASTYSWTFTTGAGPDLTPPTISTTIPANGSVGAAADTSVRVLFDEAMDPATVNGTTFTLTQGGTPVSGAVSLNAGHDQATFTPSARLLNSTAYTATVTTGAKDAAGNALATSYSWSFTTANSVGGGVGVGGTANLTIAVRATPQTLPPEGGDVTFTYAVSNPNGSAHIGDVAVEDDLGTDTCSPVKYVSGDTDNDGALDPGKNEVMTFTCTKHVTKTVTHVAVATGTWNQGTGSSNPASVEVLVGGTYVVPGIDLYAAMTYKPLPAVGGTATFHYDVVNIGDVPVTDIRFPQGFCTVPASHGGDTNNDGALNPSETWTYTCTTDITQTTQRAVIVEGKSGDIGVTATLNLVVEVAGTTLKTGGLNLNVRANPIRLPAYGGTTILTYQITNLGDIPLTAVHLDPGSDTCASPTSTGGDTNGNGSLDPGEKWTYTCNERLETSEVDTVSVQAYANGRIVTDSMSFAVPVAGEAPPVEDPTKTGPYDAETAKDATPDIDTDKALALATGQTPCVPGIVYKLADDGDPTTQVDTTVYYCGRDGKRYDFPNAKIYFSWYPDFSNVRIIDALTMAQIPFAGSVTYHPGARMIKVASDTKVYAVSRNGTLRWITTEALAAQLYGPDWRKMVDDIPDSFFALYVLGAPIE